MSSHTDMNTQNAQLRLELDILEEDVRGLKRENTKLKVESRLIAGITSNPAPQPTAPTESSDPVLRAEISQLHEALARKDAEIASKDAEIASKDAIIARRHWILSDTIKSMTRYERSLNAMAEDIDHTRAAAAAEIDRLTIERLTPKIEVADTDGSSEPASSSSSKDVKDEGVTKPKTPSSSSAPKDVKSQGETKPKTPSFGATRSKLPEDAATAPPESVKPNYFQALQAPKKGPVFAKRTLPPVAIRNDCFNPFKQQQSVQRDRSPSHETQKGRADQSARGDRGLEKGLTPHDNPPEVHDSLTLRPAVNQETMSANAKGKNAIGALESTDQLSRKTDIGPAAAYPNRLSSEAASYVANTPGMILDNKGSSWDAGRIQFNILIRASVPPEVMAAYKSGALRVSAVSTDHWGASRPNVKKRSADEEQPGTEAPVKRLRST